MKQFLTAIGIALIVSGTSAPAHAAPPADRGKPGGEVTADIEDAEVKEHLLSFGVSEQDADRLIADFNAGQLPDSLTKDVDPISVESWSEGNFLYEQRVYPDSSVSVHQLEVPHLVDPISPSAGVNKVEPQTVSGCSALSNKDGWIRRANCLVKDSYGWNVMQFRADYSVKTGAGRVDAVYSPYVQAVGCGWKNHSLSITRKLSSGSAPAVARHTITCQMLKYGYDINWWQELYVLTSAWSKSN